MCTGDQGVLPETHQGGQTEEGGQGEKCSVSSTSSLTCVFLICLIPVFLVWPSLLRVLASLVWPLPPTYSTFWSPCLSSFPSFSHLLSSMISCIPCVLLSLVCLYSKLMAYTIQWCRLADALKVEGNTFYGNGELEAAIECYTQALDTCPLKCTEKRVTYHRYY